MPGYVLSKCPSYVVPTIPWTNSPIVIILRKGAFLITDLSDLMIVGTCDILVYRMHHQIM